MEMSREERKPTTTMIEERQPMPSASRSDVPLAVVGMSCRLPGAANLAEYWRLIESGGDAAGELPHEVLDRELYYDPRKGQRGKSYSTIGGMCPRPPFDNRKCRLPEDEIRAYDPAHLTMGELRTTRLATRATTPSICPSATPACTSVTRAAAICLPTS